MSERPVVCLQWPRFGPYHLARLRAAHARLANRFEVVGLETASADSTYAWREETAAEPFRREVVFPNADYDALDAAAMADGVTAALGRLQPAAVAVNAYSLPDALACLRWCRRHRRAAVLMMESTEHDAARSAPREWLKGHLVRAFDAALAGGTAQRRYLERLGFPSDRVFVPYDVVDNAFFRDAAAEARAKPAPALPGLDDPTPFFLASNRFVARKNLKRLLRAYAAYRRAAGDLPWRLLLLGDGPLRPDLETLVHDAAIEGVVFCGFQQIEALPTYYAHAGAFVHPTLVEPWGLVVNEAMAAGLPVLVSDRAGCAPDLVRNGENGYTFDPEDEAALARLLTRMAAAPDEERAAMGRRSEALVAGWSPARFAEGLEAAVEAGRTSADRPMPLVPRLLLAGLRFAGRDPRAHHTLDY